MIFVPPHASTFGLDAGKSACARPSGLPLGWSPEPASPAAQQIVTPSAAAPLNAWSYESSACDVHVFSAPPQLIEITDGLCVVSWTAIVIASRKPFVVFGVKYTTIFAFGATAAATSMSSITSPSDESAFDGELLAPSTRTVVTDGFAMPSPLK